MPTLEVAMPLDRTQRPSEKTPEPAAACGGPSQDGSRHEGVRDSVRGLGYQAGAALLSPRVQAKLRSGTPGDSHEREADRVAGHVMARLSAPAPGPAVSKGPNSMAPAVSTRTSPAATLSASGGGGGMPVSPEAADSIQAARGSGDSLPGGVQSRMEGAFGADFGGVKVHADPKADGLCQTLGNARALTSGKDIFFGQGQFQPTSPGGQQLLAHELTHTLQQGSGDRVAGWWADAHEQITQAAGAEFQDRIGREAIDYVATRAGTIDQTVRSATNFAYGLGIKGGERDKYEKLEYDPAEDRKAQQGGDAPAPTPTTPTVEPQPEPEEDVAPPQEQAPEPRRPRDGGLSSLLHRGDLARGHRQEAKRQNVVREHDLDLGVDTPETVQQLRANDTRKKGKDDLGIKWRKLSDSEKKRAMWDNLMFHVRWTRETKYHGEAGQYVNESAESVNRLAVDDQTRKAAERYRGGARREGLLQLSDAVHNAEDRGSHGEGRPYTGHDPRLTMPRKFDGTVNERYVPGWDCDNPSKNSGGRAMAEIYAKEVFQNFLFLVGVHTSEKVKGGKEDPSQKLKQGQGGLGKSMAIRTGTAHALRFKLESTMGRSVPKKNQDVESWLRNPEEYQKVKMSHPQTKLSSRPEDNMPAYRESAGKEVAGLLLRELDEAGAVLGILMSKGQSGKGMEGGFAKLSWIGKHAEELAGLIRATMGEPPNPAAISALMVLDILQEKGAEWSTLAKGSFHKPATELRDFLVGGGPRLRFALTELFGLSDVEGGVKEPPDEGQTAPTVDTGVVRMKAGRLLAEMESTAKDLRGGRIGPAEMEKKLKRYSLLGQWAGELKGAVDGLPTGGNDEARRSLSLMLGNLVSRAGDWAARAGTSGTTRHSLRDALKDEILRDIEMYGGVLPPQFRTAIGMGVTQAPALTGQSRPLPTPPPKPRRPAPPPPQTTVVEQQVTEQTRTVPQPREDAESPVQLLAGARDTARRLLDGIGSIRHDLRSGLVGAADLERDLGRYTLLRKSVQETLLAFQKLGPGSRRDENQQQVDSLRTLVRVGDEAAAFARRANEVSLRGHKALRQDVLDFSERLVDFVSKTLEDRLVLYASLHVSR
jgi:hypothetical protein